jgi:hypothetical protein
VDVERVATLLLWPTIGLIAWWASSSRPEPAGRWLLIHLVLGPLMLVPLTWRFVTAPTPAGRDATTGGKASTSTGRGVGQLDREQDIATGTNVRRRRRGHRR